MSIACSIAAVVLALQAVESEALRNLKAFPPAEDGMVRHVLVLPPQHDDADFRVQLIVGKTVELDEHNRFFFGGALEEETIEGWGFTAMRLRELGPMAGTLMGVDPEAPKVARFVTLGGDPQLVRYNSRLPLVVYTPEGVEVRYRIWIAGPETRPMPKG